ncbi:MAG: hypothetical protein P8Y45_07550 [Exilibacterium sp.]
MLFGKSRKNRSVVTTSLLAGGSFVALAVWGWDLPLSTVGQFLLISLVCLVAIILVAAVGVGTVVAVKKFFRQP